jgi:DNA-binding response OmpR family regulator
MEIERRRAYRALVVEDDEAILRLVKIVLGRENFIVEGVKSAQEAITLLDSVAYDLLIIDLILPAIGGEKVIDFLEMRRPNYLRRVILTTASPRAMSCEFLEKICRLLTKPFDIDQLIIYAKECAEVDVA